MIKHLNKFGDYFCHLGGKARKGKKRRKLVCDDLNENKTCVYST
jgi:hypothetical protein